MKKKYTIKDIAKLAGVSKGTVDRVLHKRGKVSSEALKKVTAILEAIDYKPNIIAQNLKQNKTFFISVLLPDPNADNYWQRCKDGILRAQSELAPFNVEFTIHAFNPFATVSFIAEHEQILKQKPDAVLLAPLFYKEAQQALTDYHALKIPTITFNNQIAPDITEGFVGQDLIQSGRVAAKLFHCIHKTGHISIIHINEDITNALHMQQKEQGFTSYFKDIPEFKISTLHVDAKNIKTVIKKYLKSNPDIAGLFITTSKIHLVASALPSTNNVFPTLIGYDLLSTNINFLKSGRILFLIHQNPKQQAYLGATALAEHLIYQNSIPKTTFLPIDIINSENLEQYLS